MSRFEGEFRATDDASVDPIELLAALSPGRSGKPERGEAMACFLSVGSGWRDAAATLGGTFAAAFAIGTKLTPGQEE